MDYSRNKKEIIGASVVLGCSLLGAASCSAGTGVAEKTVSPFCAVCGAVFIGSAGFLVNKLKKMYCPQLLERSKKEEQEIEKSEARPARPTFFIGQEESPLNRRIIFEPRPLGRDNDAIRSSTFDVDSVYISQRTQHEARRQPFVHQPIAMPKPYIARQYPNDDLALSEKVTIGRSDAYKLANLKRSRSNESAETSI